MRARDRFQFASSRAGQWDMHRQMFDTLVAPKTVASRRNTASKISFVLPVTVAGSAIRIVVILSSSGSLRGPASHECGNLCQRFLPPAGHRHAGAMGGIAGDQD